MDSLAKSARLAQSVERKALNLVVVGSSPTVGAFIVLLRDLKDAIAKCSVQDDIKAAPN